MKRGAIGALVASAVMALLWAGIASAAAGSGTLEICKAGDNGAAGQKFNISYAKGTATPTTVTVTGGTCNAGDHGARRHLHASGGPLERPLGHVRILGHPAGQLGLRERPPRQAQGHGRRERRDAGDARQQPSRRTIKVCKWSASPALQGAQFSFTVNGQTVTAVAGKNAANAGLLDRALDAARHQDQGAGDRADR